ncbi:hypothetical protein FSP39_022804 [Pinctada imbricata]|uniref:DNA polymerase kappa n=1 Tax=Pinctada imbricata TaxID=66713 RepID=A0AA88YBE2_PINIB|nr:hypothetical protein FSP39_022804 [Pinctada imbricata]
MLLNDHKAGMEGLDKGKINKIIMDASKGSRFYENERKKEDQVNKRIEEQRRKMKEITPTQLKDGELQADSILEDFDGMRDLSRTIVHIDMDMFYAAVEMRDNPSLRDKPMAVGGLSMLSTSNYHARKFGVRAAMPGFIGKKLCPELVIVPLNFDKYTAVSKQVRDILSDYDSNFCPMSLDEAYLDMTDHVIKRSRFSDKERTYLLRKVDKHQNVCLCDLNETIWEEEIQKSQNNCEENNVSSLNNCDTKDRNMDAKTNYSDTESPNVLRSSDTVCVICGKPLPDFEKKTFGFNVEDAVREMRSRIEQRTTLTASAGIAPNMMLAKICSDRNKPNGQYIIQNNKDAVMEFIKDLPIRKISGIGKVTEKMLNALGIQTTTDLYHQRALLFHLYSQISFHYFMRICLGIGSTTVERESGRKSMSTERTFREISTPIELYAKCRELSEALAEDLKEEELKGKTVGIKVKTVKFEVKTRVQTLPEYTCDVDTIFTAARDLLRIEIQNVAPQPLRLRLMGVRMSGLLHQTMCKKQQNTLTSLLKKMESTQQSVSSSKSSATSFVKMEGITEQPSVNCDENICTYANEERSLIEKNCLSLPEIPDQDAYSENDMCYNEVNHNKEYHNKLINDKTQDEIGSNIDSCGNPDQEEITSDDPVTSSTHEDTVKQLDQIDGSKQTVKSVIDKRQESSLKIDTAGQESTQKVTQKFNTTQKVTPPTQRVTPTKGDSTSTKDDLSLEKDTMEKLVCPVCFMEQSQADLDSFNQHVDSCLNKDAIMQILTEQKSWQKPAAKR